MILECVAVYDTKAGVYQMPVMCATLQQFHEAMYDIVNNRDHTFYYFPADFIVFHLGKWNPETAGFAMFNEPKNLGSLVQYFKGERCALHNHPGPDCPQCISTKEAA